MSYPERAARAACATAQERDFQVRVYGVDLDILREKAERAAGRDGRDRRTRRADGRAGSRASRSPRSRSTSRRRKQFGVKPGDVRRAAAAVLQGIEVGYMFEEQKVFQVIVKGTGADPPQPHRCREPHHQHPWRQHRRALGMSRTCASAPTSRVIRHDDTHRAHERRPPTCRAAASPTSRPTFAPPSPRSSSRSSTTPRSPAQYGEQQAAGPADVVAARRRRRRHPRAAADDARLVAPRRDRAADAAAGARGRPRRRLAGRRSRLDRARHRRSSRCSRSPSARPACSSAAHQTAVAAGRRSRRRRPCGLRGHPRCVRHCSPSWHPSPCSRRPRSSAAQSGLETVLPIAAVVWGGRAHDRAGHPDRAAAARARLGRRPGRRQLDS